MPQELLSYPPAYCAVGIYRLLTDPKLREPVWAKCRHGVTRGVIVGAVWAALTWPVQRAYVNYFVMRTPSITGLSAETFLGIPLPFHIPAAVWSTLLLLSSQFELILKFFLSKNLRISRARAYDLTIRSRGKPDEFWGTYVEEWKEPPAPPVKEWHPSALLSNYFMRMVLRQAIILPILAVQPSLGLAVSAAIRALGMARSLHAPYFAAKKMDARQVEVFMAEHTWDYRLFGFAAALCETIPFVGVLFSISNRVGAAMWAFDLEKRQDKFRKGELQPIDRPKPPSFPPDTNTNTDPADADVDAGGPPVLPPRPEKVSGVPPPVPPRQRARGVDPLGVGEEGMEMAGAWD